jgi:signal transduction histidine kinase
MSSGAADTESLQSVFEQMDLPVVQYEATDDSTSLDVVYTNETFEDVFEMGVDEPPERLPCPANLDSGASITAFGEEIDPHDTHNSDILSTVLVGDDQQQIGELPADETIIESFSDEGRRKFICNQFRLDDNVYVEIYRDITQRTRQGQYLDVLQRLFRHNLRNDLNVILGNVGIILDELDDECDETASIRESIKEVQRKTSELIRLSEETQIIRSVIGTPEQLQAIDLGRIASDVCQQQQEKHPQAEIELDTSEPTTILGTHRVEHLFESLVSNGIQHNEGTPHVEVTIENQNDSVLLTVRDDGPGIPTTEQEVVTGETDISSLTHGSGLGLWIVRWIADRHGAFVSFPDDSVGSTVSVRFQTP